MGTVLHLDLTAEQAWQRYVDLVNEQRRDERLRTDLDHNRRIVRAWGRFRDLYLQGER